MISAEAHFDESIGQKGPNITCVAGFVFESQQAKKMRREWNTVLAQHQLAYFRMSDCAHGNGVFLKFKNDKPRRIRIATQMINIIRKRALLGMAATVDNDEFQANVPKLKYVGGAYSLLTRSVMSAALVYFEQKKITGKVVYFYEAGHASQHEANRIMTGIFKDATTKKTYLYGGHSFVPKDGNPGIQAADLLAWQWYTDRRYQLENKPRRKDLTHLMDGPFFYAVHLDPEKLVDLVSSVQTTARENNLSADDIAIM